MKSDLIYDVGMNNGDDTAYYLSRGYQVLAIEANPVLARAAETRFAKEVASGKLRVLNVGVGENDGEFPFWICDSHSEWSSFNRDIASREGASHHEVKIPCRRFSSILAEHGVPYYLKIDIEGNDMLCVHELTPGGDLPKYLSLECAIPEPIAILEKLGYNRFQCVSQRNFLSLQFPPTAAQVNFESALNSIYSRRWTDRIRGLLGAKQRWRSQLEAPRLRGNWRFPEGSSGPFGDALDGEWQSGDEMRRTYDRFLKMIAAREKSVIWDDKEYSFWVDLHARRDD